MIRNTARKPIPWIHNQNPLVTSWMWETDHFIVTIYAEGLTSRKLYNWKINDKSSGRPVPFDSAGVESFAASVDAAVEVIAKSYPRELGYQEYAGELATTFTVSDGRRVDLGKIIGDSVIIRAHDGYGGEQLIMGTFDIRNYDISIQTGENELVIVPPEKVIDIQKEYGSTSVLNSLGNDIKSTKNKRIFHDEWRKGCTGKPGFNPGTVMHSPNDPFCPIHNI